jgi:UDP-3-O-[3-hydroxymyristoyl] glucosamine N-acyltransferase
MAPPSPIVAPAGHSLSELAQLTGAQLVDGDGALRVTHVADLDSAGEGAIAFLTDPAYRAQLATTRASAVIVGPGAAAETSRPKLVHANPYATYAKVAALLHPRAAAEPGVHPLAAVAAGARVAPSASIAAHATIAAGAVIGERVRVGAGCAIGAGASVGDDSELHANVTVYDRCVIGPRCVIHSGVVIGADGFGMVEEGGRWLKVPQVGRAVIGADVEIGANTTIDRGTIGDTVIEDDVKLDNLIQIGHNCRIGRHTAIAGCVGIAGSTRIGRNCRIGGAAMFSGHIDICDGTLIRGATTVYTSIDKPGDFTGAFPMLDHRTWKRLALEWPRFATFGRRLRALERRVEGAPAQEPAAEEGGKEAT